MNVTIKKDEESGEYYIDINELAHLFEDSSIIDTYSMEQKEDGSIVLSFFDVDGNKVVPTKL